MFSKTALALAWVDGMAEKLPLQQLRVGFSDTRMHPWRPAWLQHSPGQFYRVATTKTLYGGWSQPLRTR